MSSGPHSSILSHDFKLQPEVEFLQEVDRLKGVLRQTLILDQSRRENTAEHSWHLATAVLACHHLADEPVNLERALKIALVHDIVEIDAGDTFLYDEKLSESKFANESKAADRIFGLLPVNGPALQSLWLAYETRTCPESKFVYALDRFLPMMANCMTQGYAWRQNKVTFQQVWAKNQPIENGSKKLWQMAKTLLENAKRDGHLPEKYEENS